jgi:hypothetical protein
MYVRKLSGRVIGAELTATEKRAMDIEIGKVFAEYDRKNTTEIDAIVLFLVAKHFDADADKLKEVYNDFISQIEALADRYELEDEDNPWLYTQLLKQIGVDIDAWRKERN